MPDGLGGLLGNETLRAILVWQVLGQAMQPLMEPFVQDLRNQVLKEFHPMPLSVADLADMVVRSVVDDATGAEQASESGYDRTNFERMVHNAGEPPGIEMMLAAFRRGLVPEKGAGPETVSLEQGLRESRLKNKYIPLLERMRTVPISPGEAIEAWQRGNLSEAEAKKIAYQGGIDEAGAEVLHHNAGRPPSPVELMELMRRGLIPMDGTGPEALTFQQGIYEGDAKNKWWKMYAALANYIPPPRTVTALLREGAITHEQALAFFRDAGLSEQLAEAYVRGASKQKSQVQKELSQAEVLTLYSDGLISKDAAQQDLVKLGFHAQDAAELLDLQTVKRERQLQQQVVTHVRTLYVGRKIEEQEAVSILETAGVQLDERSHLLKLWDLERRAPVLHVTAAEVTSAVNYGLLTVPQGNAMLQSLGYSAFEAWLALGVRLHGPPPGIPKPAIPAALA